MGRRTTADRSVSQLISRVEAGEVGPGPLFEPDLGHRLRTRSQLAPREDVRVDDIRLVVAPVKDVGQLELPGLDLVRLDVIGSSVDEEVIVPLGPRVIEVVLRPLLDRKSTRLNSSHVSESRMPSSA